MRLHEINPKMVLWCLRAVGMPWLVQFISCISLRGLRYQMAELATRLRWGLLTGLLRRNMVGPCFCGQIAAWSNYSLHAICVMQSCHRACLLDPLCMPCRLLMV